MYAIELIVLDNAHARNWVELLAKKVCKADGTVLKNNAIRSITNIENVFLLRITLLEMPDMICAIMIAIRVQV